MKCHCDLQPYEINIYEYKKILVSTKRNEKCCCDLKNIYKKSWYWE